MEENIDIKELISPLSYVETYLDSINDDGSVVYNTVIALYNYAYTGTGKHTDTVVHLGVFDYEF